MASKKGTAGPKTRPKRKGRKTPTKQAKLQEKPRQFLQWVRPQSAAVATTKKERRWGDPL